MAAKTIALTDGASVLRWSRKVGTEAIWKSLFFRPDYGFVGTGMNNMIVRKEELADRIGGGKLTCTLTMQMTGDGLVDGASAEGSESSYDHFTDAFEVHELGSEPFAVKSQLDQQYVEWDLVQQGKNVVSDWWSVPLNAGPAMCLGGATFTSALDYYKPHGRLVRAGSTDGLGNQYTMMNTSTVPSTGRLFLANGVANAQTLSTTNPIDLDDIDELIDTAPQTKPPMRPAKWSGGEHFIIFLHTDQWSDLMTSTRYDAIIQSLLQGGQPYEKNTWGTGNAIPYRNCCFVVSNWNPPAQNSSTAAALANSRVAFMCGAQALMVGWGQGHAQNRFRWHIEPYNIGGSKRMIARSMWGGKKTVYNSKDYAVLALATSATNRGDA